MNEKYDVVYKVPELTGDTEHIRTYGSAQEAEEHYHDIRGYAGVTGCYMRPHQPSERVAGG